MCYFKVTVIAYEKGEYSGKINLFSAIKIEPGILNSARGDVFGLSD